MKQCPVCGALHGDEQAQCACGADLTRQQPLPPPAQAAPPVQMGSLPPVPPFAGRPFVPSPPRPAFVPKTYTWADVLTVLGFTAALTGYFRAGILLLPLGLVASLAGFWGNKQRGRAVAGVVISAVGLLLEIMSILEKNCLLPYWLTDGVFFL